MYHCANEFSVRLTDSLGFYLDNNKKQHRRMNSTDMLDVAVHLKVKSDEIIGKKELVIYRLLMLVLTSIECAFGGNSNLHHRYGKMGKIAPQRDIRILGHFEPILRADHLTVRISGPFWVFRLTL